MLPVFSSTLKLVTRSVKPSPYKLVQLKYSFSNSHTQYSHYVKLFQSCDFAKNNQRYVQLRIRNYFAGSVRFEGRTVRLLSRI
jgi:hypothetical protein